MTGQTRAKSVGIAYALVLMVPGAAAASGACVSIACGAPGEQYGARSVSSFWGCSAVAWQELSFPFAGTFLQVRAAKRGPAPGWPANGLLLPPDSGVVVGPNPLLAPLGDSGVVLVWQSRTRLGHGIYDAVLRSDHGEVPGPDSLKVGSLVDPTTTLVAPEAIFASGPAHALVVLSVLDSMGDQFGLVKEIPLIASGPTGWPVQGVQLRAPTGLYPAAACADGSGGCYVLAGTIPPCTPRPLTICPEQLRVIHLDATGARVGPWANGELTITDSSAADHPRFLVPDGDGGAYVVWHEPGIDSVTAIAIRVAPDGPVPGWPQGGRPVIAVAQFEQGVMGTGCARGGDLVLMIRGDGKTGPWITTLTPYGASPPAAASAIHLLPANEGFTFWADSDALIALDTGELMALWRETVNQNYAIVATALDSNGVPLSSWTARGRPLVTSASVLAFPEPAAATAGQFDLVWNDDSGPDPNVAFAKLEGLDGSCAEEPQVRLGQSLVQGGHVECRWSVRGAFGRPMAWRSIDGSAFEPAGSPSSPDATTLALSDTPSAGWSSARYVLVSTAGLAAGLSSDTATVERGPAREKFPLAIRAHVEPGGWRAVVSVSGARGELRVELFDLLGRATARRTFAPEAYAAGSIPLDVGALAQGWYRLRVRDASGRSATTGLALVR